MKTKLKIWARRLMLRWLRKAFDAAEEKLHAAEVRFRDERAAGIPVPVPVESPRLAKAERPTVSCPYPLPADEFVRHRIRGRVSRDRQPQCAPQTANGKLWPYRTAQRKRSTAADFDRRFERVTL